ncbi:MAG: DEAD/DEAH box helicase [Treponema sp.]|jgi:ATP-dependent Lhr-like helicase|nr:DEAD/DEAH box helicase [Treponema sp.]
MLSPYSRLAPFIREYVYREKWTEMRKIQEEAIEAVFDRRDHLLIAAGTASGKTEAAFFPVLSALDRLSRKDAPAEAPPRCGAPEAPGFRPLVLYISPLKALINDQAGRLERIIRSGEEGGEENGAERIKVWRWHGDAPGGRKNRFLDEPEGVLLITPESLESLLLHRGRELGRIFAGLLFTVIDEVHAFMGSDRGSQLLCQLARIEEARRENPASSALPPPRRIGLSATLADYDGARRWLSLGTGLATSLLRDEGGGRMVRIALDYHSKRGDAFYEALYGECRFRRSIIFTESRLEAEECAASLGRTARLRGEPDIFYVHHGSVSALLRNEAEEALKSGEGPGAACATATLELGIDIGGLDRIIQLGPPRSVSAFVQRLGRSGRRSGRAEMFFSVAGEERRRAAEYGAAEPDPGAIAWDLLRTIAVIQLYLEKRWIEPPEEKPLPLSLLIHETLSVLGSLGERRAETLSGGILGLPPFARIPPEDYRALLLRLENCGLVERTEEGGYILGLEGERITGRHGFYSVFPGEETFRVILEGREIGAVHFVPGPGSVLAVGGRRWVVKSVDGRRREIWVEETGDGGGERLWRGRGGGIHSRIAGTMRRLLTEEGGGEKSCPPYLSPAARNALEESRRIARALGLAEKTLVFMEEETPAEKNGASDTKNQAPRTAFLFPWTGSAGMRTLEFLFKDEKNKRALRIASVQAEHESCFRIETALGANAFRSALEEARNRTLALFTGEGPEGRTAGNLRRDLPYTDKYDYLLPPELHAKAYLANMLDPEALRAPW